MDKTMRPVGCRMVAQSKLLMESGVIKSSSFDPDVYMEWMRNKGYLNSGFYEQGTTGDGMIKYASSIYGVKITRGSTVNLTGDFKSASSSTDRTKIMQMINAGYYVILGCSAHHAYVSSELSKALGEPIVLNSTSDRSSDPKHAHTLRRDTTMAYTHAYCYKVGPSPTPTVTFNANGGNTLIMSKIVTTGAPLGTMPVPSYEGHVFAGWFTSGKNYVNASTTVTAKSDFTLTARYYPSYAVERTSAPISGVNAKRVTDALIVLIKSESATGTNAYGCEVLVDSGGTVTKLEDLVGNATVPKDGFIISGHGAMRQWLKDNVRVGDKVAYDDVNKRVVVYESAKRGDLNSDGDVDANDAIYLLYNVFFGGENYPVTQACDFDSGGSVTANDAIYLLYHVFFGDDSYPI